VDLAELRYVASGVDQWDSAAESPVVRARVIRARDTQLRRYARRRIYCNAQLGAGDNASDLQPSGAALGLLERAGRAFHLSARVFERTLRVARTIADLSGVEAIEAEHVSEALNYRRPGLDLF
jgi:magnesium chelatase family protein